MRKPLTIILASLFISVAPNAMAWNMSLTELSKVLKDGDITPQDVASLVKRCNSDPKCNIVPEAPPNDDGESEKNILNYKHAIHIQKLQTYSGGVAVKPNQTRRVISQSPLKAKTHKTPKAAPCPGPMCPDEL